MSTKTIMSKRNKRSEISMAVVSNKYFVILLGCTVIWHNPLDKNRP